MLKTVSSITNAIGALNFKGTWNAATNTPTIVSGVGVKGDYFVVSVEGSTTIDGISNWGIGDWIVYNGNIWQRVEGGADLNGVNLTVTNTTTLSGLTASTALALDASKNVVSVTNTGTGNNVLADGPTLTTPTLGVASATSINKVALTAPATGSTLTVADGKTLTANNSLTLAGTDATTMTFPSTSQTVAGLGVAQTFTAAQTVSNTVTATKLIPTGNVTAGNGMYLPAANTVAISTNGSQIMNFGSTGSVRACTATDSVFFVGNTYVNNINTNNKIGIEAVGPATNRSFSIRLFPGPGSVQPADSSFRVSVQHWNGSNYIQREVFIVNNAGNLEIIGGTATKASGTTWANPSDQRIKDNIRDYEKGLDKLQQVRVREWEYNGKGGTTEGTKGLGVIADEIMSVLPNTVDTYEVKLNEDDEEVSEIKRFDATEITWLLVNAVKELKAITDTQAQTISALEARIETLEAKVAATGEG